jgi:hypothetical protein
MLSKLIFPIIIALVIMVIYYTYFVPSNELGSFSKFSSGAEINQRINVRVVKSMEFEKDANGNINSFYAKDLNNVEVKVTLHEPIPAVILNAEVIELLGHMHENSFTAAKITIIDN